MRIAIPFDKDSGQVAAQFEEAASFKLYTLVNDSIASDLTLPSFGKGAASMLEFLRTAKADVLICGGITGEARKALADAGLVSYPGFGGRADDLARAFASGSLQQSMSGECAGCTEGCGEGGCPHHHDGRCEHHHRTKEIPESPGSLS